MGARETALNALIACRKNAAWSNGILKEYVVRDRLDRRDAALAARLCYGVLQNRNKLDFYLKQLLTGKLKDLHPVVHDILHLGLYQIYELDKIPDNAAVNESVDLAKKYCPKQRFAPGLVNGVLRSAVREKENLKAPTGWQEQYSHPQKLIDFLKSYVGKKTEGMLRANNETPETVVQVNTLRTTTEELIAKLKEEEVTALPHPWMPDCLVLSNTGSLEKLQAFKDGLFYVQDAASKLAVRCAGIQAGDATRVLDCCAAPGGKTTQIAGRMLGEGFLLCNEINPKRAKILSRNIERMAVANALVTNEHPARLAEKFPGYFDRVLVDAPCSGEGMFRKEEAAVTDWSQETVEMCARRQADILNSAAKLLKSGGRLVYSTCTLNPDENEHIVTRFLKEHPEFRAIDFDLGAAGGSTDGMRTFYPHLDGCDGFFIAKMVRS